MFKGFLTRGRASFIIGGQWGSEGKGAAAAFLARRIYEYGDCEPPAVVTTNAGAQAGHTSTHGGTKRVVFHLPTVPLIARTYGASSHRGPVSLLNAGAIIDPDVLMREIADNEILKPDLVIHPRAAVITPDCRLNEGREDSPQTRIASTRKGVGEALARKVLRSGMLAYQHPDLCPYIDSLSASRLPRCDWAPVLVEVPQGIGLSLNEQFYPHCTSRNCTVAQAMSDAELHPHQYGASLLVLRTYPIRVGSLSAQNHSGGYYSDQSELRWDDLGVKPEITTVTKRVRRVFTFSVTQMTRAMELTRPSHVQLTFCDYPGPAHYVRDIADAVRNAARTLGMQPPKMLFQYGPTTDDVFGEILT